MVEPVQTAGKLDEQRFRGNVVGKEVPPEEEHAVTARGLPEEEQRSLAALLDDRGVELRTEELVHFAQPSTLIERRIPKVLGFNAKI